MLKPMVICASYCDRISRERGMNYTLIATPAEGLSGRFVCIGRPNSASSPASSDWRDFDWCLSKKIDYHALTNGGHINAAPTTSTSSAMGLYGPVTIRHVDRDPVWTPTTG